MLPITVENDHIASLNMWNGKVMYCVSVLGTRVCLLSPSSLQKYVKSRLKMGQKLVCLNLFSVATKHVATLEIQESLLSAEELGQSKLDTFVEERLAKSTVKFRY